LFSEEQYSVYDFKNKRDAKDTINKILDRQKPAMQKQLQRFTINTTITFETDPVPVPEMEKRITEKLQK